MKGFYMCKNTLTILLIILSLNLLAKEVSFFNYVEEYAKGNKLNYSISPDVKDFKFNIFGKDAINQEDVFKIITIQAMLNNKAVLLGGLDSFFKIVAGREIKSENFPTYTDEKLLPDNYQFVRFIYNVSFLDSREITRNLRPILSRNGRIKDEGIGNKIIITDSAKNISKILKIIKTIDTSLTKKYEWEEKELKEELNKLSERREGFWDVVTKQHGLFIILFSLIFLIIGFLFRGYMIRRIEGGL